MSRHDEPTEGTDERSIHFYIIVGMVLVFILAIIVGMGFEVLA